MNNRSNVVISSITIILLVILGISATFAYFQAQTGEGKTTDVTVTANTVDVFTFEVGDPITLNINQDNFASGTNSMSDTTTAKAILTANNKTNTATKNYYLYLDIKTNTFTYSRDTSTPEVLLTVTDGSGTELTSVTGLTHVTLTDAKGTSLSGFDITNKTGLITLLSNRSITTTTSKTETWNVKLTFVNHNFNQAANAGKSITTELIIQQNAKSN